jgi:hypothetical protein
MVGVRSDNFQSEANRVTKKKSIRLCLVVLRRLSKIRHDTTRLRHGKIRHDMIRLVKRPGTRQSKEDNKGKEEGRKKGDKEDRRRNKTKTQQDETIRGKYQDFLGAVAYLIPDWWIKSEDWSKTNKSKLSKWRFVLLGQSKSIPSAKKYSSEFALLWAFFFAEKIRNAYFPKNTYVIILP